MKILLIFALFALLVFAVVRWQMGQYLDFMSCAAKTTAKIISKTETKPMGDVKGGRTEHILLYSYTLDGREYSASDTIEFSDLWQDFAEGQEIEIYYSKKAPEQSHPVSVMNRRLGAEPTTIGDDC